MQNAAVLLDLLRCFEHGQCRRGFVKHVEVHARNPLLHQAHAPAVWRSRPPPDIASLSRRAARAGPQNRWGSEALHSEVTRLACARLFTGRMSGHQGSLNASRLIAVAKTQKVVVAVEQLSDDHICARYPLSASGSPDRRPDWALPDASPDSPPRPRQTEGIRRGSKPPARWRTQVHLGECEMSPLHAAGRHARRRCNPLPSALPDQVRA